MRPLQLQQQEGLIRRMSRPYLMLDIKFRCWLWAVCGCIGHNAEIDTVQLGPHVNFTRLAGCKRLRLSKQALPCRNESPPFSSRSHHRWARFSQPIVVGELHHALYILPRPRSFTLTFDYRYLANSQMRASALTRMVF